VRKKLSSSICQFSLAVCAYRTKSVAEQRFFHESALYNKALKTFVEFRICRKRSKRHEPEQVTYRRDVISSNRIRQHSNFEHFQQIQNSTNVLSVLLSNANLWKIVVIRLITYEQRATECRRTFLLKFNLSHKLQLLNVQRNFCSVMGYTVLIWTLFLLTLENN